MTQSMPLKRSTLEFAARQRPHVKSGNGTFQSERNYLDFVIDGQSLKDLTRYDLVTVLCREWVPKECARSVQRLLRQEPADFPGERCSLLVCGECGDIGCGAVSVVVDFSGETAVWRDFGYQNNYEPEIHGEYLRGLGPFEFDLDDYKKKLNRALETLNAAL
jgi:hypothetical protein